MTTLSKLLARERRALQGWDGDGNGVDSLSVSSNPFLEPVGKSRRLERYQSDQRNHLCLWKRNGARWESDSTHFLLTQLICTSPAYSRSWSNSSISSMCLLNSSFWISVKLDSASRRSEIDSNSSSWSRLRRVWGGRTRLRFRIVFFSRLQVCKIWFWTLWVLLLDEGFDSWSSASLLWSSSWSIDNS